MLEPQRHSADESKRKLPHFPPQAMHRSAQDLAYLRSLTIEQRGEMFIAACRAAAKIVEGRARSGLSPPQPVPWPASTVEYFRRFAPNGRRNATAG